MKRVLEIMLALGMCIICIAPATAAVIYTSGFNTDTDGNGIADGWTGMTPLGTSVFWLETSNKIEGTSAQGCQPDPYKGIMSDPIGGIAAGQTYTIKCWVYQLDGAILEFWGDGKLSSWYETVTAPGSWIFFQTLVVANSSSNPAQIAIDGHAAGAGFLVDQLTVEEGDTRLPMGNVSGQIQLLDYLGDSLLCPVRVQTFPHAVGGTAWTQVVFLTANPGTYNLDPSIMPGTYDIAFSTGKFLRKVLLGVVVGAGGNVVNAQLENGDLDGDNAVTSTDLSISLKNQ